MQADAVEANQEETQEGHDPGPPTQDVGAPEDEVTGNASDQGTLMEVSTAQPSEIATAGSTEGAEEQRTDTAAPLLSRNRLRNCQIGSLLTQPAQAPPPPAPEEQGEEAANNPPEQDQGHDPGPPPQDVDAPERTEEQGQEKENGEAEKESERPPPEGDKPEGEGEKDAGEGQESSRQPPDPLEPPDPDEPPNPDDEEDEEGEEDDEAQEEGEVGEDDGHGEEEEKVEDDLVEVESPSTKKKRKLSQRKEKVNEAAMQRLPYFLAEGEPMYRGVDAPARDKPRVNTQWSPRKGSIALAKDTTI